MLGSWKKSLQYAYYNHGVISRVNAERQVSWIIVDLSLTHIQEKQVNHKLDQMLNGLNRLFKYKRIKQVTLGYFRMLEVVKVRDWYQPTIHLLLPMIKSYFQGRYYIKKDEWVSLWARSMDQEPIEHLNVSITSLNEKECTPDMMRSMEDGLAMLADMPEEASFKGTNPFSTRRLVGYSRLLKEHLVKEESDISYDVAQYLINDSIANQAFHIMKDWHLGLWISESKQSYA